MTLVFLSDLDLNRFAWKRTVDKDHPSIAAMPNRSSTIGGTDHLKRLGRATSMCRRSGFAHPSRIETSANDRVGHYG